MAIRFYKVGDDYGEFSNFALYPISLLGMQWKTSEHYFQANKFTDPTLFQSVMDAKTPHEAASIGRSPNNKLRDDWESIKIDIMREAVTAKFSQNEKLRNLLLSTQSEKIIEASPADYFWGEGKDGSGRNELGKILMEVRSSLATQTKTKPISPWEYNSDAEPYDFFWSQGEAESILVEWQRFINQMTVQERDEYYENEVPKKWKD
ncbi:NADAR family protein [Aliiglaciecola sp. M165]|uniref:NADAR family protein n=1 Tax=Aliiglaciecola sp. M165 TaxID=2593649 RepID=UPI001C8F3577|nr:NADAR family protein [Aliiglaciecola sp. M165]